MTVHPLILTALLLGACRTDTLDAGRVAFVRYELQLGSGESNLLFADVDADGHPDLLETSGSDAMFSVHRGDGHGGFVRSLRIPAGPDPTGFDLADVDGDGALDAVVANHETTFLTWLKGDGEGRFEAGDGSRIDVAVSPHPHAVRAIDVDRDGAVDLVVDHRDGGGLLVLRGHGDGRFDAPGSVVDTGGDPYLGFAVADLDGDGHLDFVTPNPSAVGVTMGIGGGAFAPPRSVPSTAPFGVAVADFDGDGRPDILAVSGENGTTAAVHPGDGNGGFGSPARRIRAGRGGKTLAVGDFDGDGLADVVVAAWSGAVVLAFGGSDESADVRIAFDGNPWGLAVADVNGDGLDDFVVADGSGSRGTLFLSRRK